MINLNAQLAVIKVTGADSAKYLQGQLTNDINKLNIVTNAELSSSTEKDYQISAHLNHKGRMLANFIIIKTEENTFYLITNKEIVASILPRIKMFVMRSKVEISNLETNILLSEERLNNSINIRLNDKYFLVIDSTLISNNNDLNEWQQVLLELGLTLIHTKTQEKLIPQQANLDALDGISFTKGCYTGQEIVARTHYLGKIKRKLFRFETITNNNLEIGQIVVSPKMDNQEVGIIIETLGNKGLVSMQTDCIDDVFLDANNQIKLTITEIN